MKKKFWIPTVAGAILILGTAANMSNNPSQTTSDDSVVINDWLIVGEPGVTPFQPGDGALMAGYLNQSLGAYSIAMGYNHYSGGRASVAMGVWGTAVGDGSVAMGYSTNAYGRGTVVVGEYNESIFADFSDYSFTDNEDGHLFVVGNGTSQQRSNAMVVYHDGAVDVGKNPTDDTVPLQVASDGTVTVTGAVILSEAQGDISMGAFGN